MQRQLSSCLVPAARAKAALIIGERGSAMKIPSPNLACVTRIAQILLLCFISSGFIFAQSDAGLVGTWQAKETNASITLVLNADGTGKLDEANIKYTVSANKLRVNDSGTINN